MYYIDQLFTYLKVNQYNKKITQTIEVSDYSDMQELLCAADILITDYSSSIWDFSYTKKPCFLYT